MPHNRQMICFPVLYAALAISCLLLVPGARAQRAVVPGLHYNAWEEANDRSDESEYKEFTLINYFFARGTVTNQLADPSGLKGVALGPIGIGKTASGTTVGSDTENYFIEQRWIPVIAYSPAFIDNLATFRAMFEIDYSWGVSANAVQNNVGGGLNADQINLQTKNLNVSIHPTQKPGKLAIVLGTLPAYDSIYNPNLTSVSFLAQTGYKLTYMGTDATGLSVFSNYYGKQKFSFIPLSYSQPDLASDGDARFSFATLLTGEYAREILPGTVVGASYWYLRDDTKGESYAMQGMLKGGPGSAGLYAYTGTSRFNLKAPAGDVHFFGLNFHHNLGFNTSDFAASGYLMGNVGRYIATKYGKGDLDKVDIAGVAANLELKYNIGQTLGDIVTLEGIMTTGDSDPNDDVYSSAFTMNNYGLPGATWFNHKTLILFPFTSTVSNYTGAITDISNQGYGLLGGIATAAYDIVPNKLNLKLGAAYAQSFAKPPKTKTGVVRGNTVGAEVNAELRYHIRYLMTVGLHAGYMVPGNFYNGNTFIEGNPWAGFASFTWYGF